MKIRITENFIRIRITPNDAEALFQFNELKLSVCMGPEYTLQWKLLLKESQNAQMESENQLCLISIPKDPVRIWLRNQSEKIVFALADTQISLEKDYPCDHQEANPVNTFTRPQ
ncbi:MAG: hypothetical protein FJX95_08985 [Bacteroidetes bacterium]|nr:hypothetical protein [Bacteroidota bacterium]